jgi:hypothetical protein
MALQMRYIKAIAILIMVLGIFYIVGGVAAFTISNVEKYSNLTMTAFRAHGIDPKGWKSAVMLSGSIYLIIGIAAITSAIGIYKLKIWARSLWVGTSIFILAISGYEFNINYSNQMTIMDAISFSVWVIIILLSLWVLNTDKARDQFKKGHLTTG